MTVLKRTQRGISRADIIKHYITAWALHHAQAFFHSLGEICRNPVASLLTAAVIGISLALPAGFYVALENTRRVTSGWEGAVEIIAFIKMDVTDERSQLLAEELRKDPQIAQVEYVSREAALQDFRHSSGFGEAVDALDENPLPSLLLVRPRMDGNPEQATDALIKHLQTLPDIENAQYDQQWVRRLNAIIVIVQRAVYILAIFLGMAVLLIIGNTVRMLIYQRRAEIEVAKLFGATDSFIQRPFLYSGLWYGLSGGLLAWLLIVCSLKLLEGPAGYLAALYSGKFELAGLAAPETLGLIGVGMLLGLAGSWISVNYHLRAIEPS
jgi:cell division transport system permease protein